MAILGRIREKSFLLILLIALGLILFLIDPGKIMDFFNNGGGKQYVTKVNDEVVYREDFARQVEARQRPGQSNLQVVNQVYDQQVSKIVMEEEFEKLGIRVEKDQMWDLIKSRYANVPQFKNEEGVFDEGKLKEFLETQASENPRGWALEEENTAVSGKQQLYAALLKAASLPTELDGELAYKTNNNLVDIKYVYLPYSSIADSTITISKEQIKNYINAHKEEFEEEANRSIQFVYFEEKPSAEDEAAFKTKMSALVDRFKAATDNDAFAQEESEVRSDTIYKLVSALDQPLQKEVDSMQIGDVFGPYNLAEFSKLAKLTGVKMDPSVKASHILIAYKGALRANPEVTRTEEEAKEEAEKLLAEVKSSTKEFAEFAKEKSDGPSKTKGGDLGWFNKGQMVKEFNDYVFANNKGSVGLVKTDFGYHIIKVEDTKEEKKYQVAVVAKKIEPSQKTIDDLYTSASEFEVAATKGDFSEVAKEKSFTVKPVNKVTVLSENLPGVTGNQRQVVRWMFDEEAKVGDIRRFDVNGSYVVAQLTAKKEKGLMTVEEASAKVLSILRKEEKAKQLKAKVSSSVLADIASSNATTVKTANAVSMSNPTIAGAGREAKVVGAAFGMKEAQVSELIEGENGIFKIEVVKHTEAPKLDSYKVYATNTAPNIRAVIDALKKKADIEDNRAKFY